MMDYASLRQEGLRLLERMTGGQWTDFNAHDPGITLLEQLCYALTDLGYRTGFAVSDLLANGGGDPYASLHPPAAILPCNPVTTEDLRRLILDVEGVKNAWVEPVDPAAPLQSDTLGLYCLPQTREVRLTSKEPTAQPAALRGLYRILIESSGAIEDTVVKAGVARRLHENRGLGEDFAQITVLKTQPIQVEATVEVAPVDDPAALLAEIYRRLAEEISPPVPFAALAELLDAGMAVDEIFAGPRLGHGFLTEEVLANATRRTELHTSDLMHLIMGTPGVRTVSRIRIANGGAGQEWSLAVDADKVPRLDVAGSKIVLRRAGKVIAAQLPTSLAAAGAATPATGPSALLPPVGRDRNVGTYTSVQQHLPMLYGIGEMGLPDSASPERKAQARQLKAYLMFFDQLLQNSFAQLAQVKQLFAFDDSGHGVQTYFAKALEQPGLGLEDLRVLDDEHRRRVQNLVETPDSAAALERKNRFLNHLLARFAEPLGDHTLAASLQERAQRKQKLLRDYPRASSARGTGTDALGCRADGRSGLERRLRLELGLAADSGEDVIAVEHIHLRPLPEDVLVDAQGRPVMPEVPLLSAAQQADPYSLQVTFVLPAGAGRYAKPEFQQLVEQTLRAETPAHLMPYVCWLAPAAFADFVAAHATWRRLWRGYLAASLSVKLPEPDAPTKVRTIDLRGARDRVIDLLGLAETYPLQDAAVKAEQPTVDFDSVAALDIDPAQVNVRYELYDGDSPVVPACTVDGTGTLAVLVGPRIRLDHTFTIRAFKLDRPERHAFLLQSVTVKVGLKTALPAALFGVSPASPVFDYGSSVVVKVQGSQSGVKYQLIDLVGTTISTAPVLGNGAEIALTTRPLLEDTIIRITASRDFDATEGRPALSGMLDAQLPVAIRANPRLAVAVESSPLVDSQGTATLTLAGSQKSVVYVVYVRPLADPEFRPGAVPDASLLALAVPGAPDVLLPVPPCPAVWQEPAGYVILATGTGTDGTLRLAVGPLTEDCVVVLKAHKDHSAVAPVSSDLQLSQAVAILVRPDLVPGLTLQLTRSPDGQSGSLLVQGGQPGVLYHFRRGSEASELGLPAYFHKVDATDASQNKGIGQLRIGTDVIVARDPPPVVDPSLDLPHRRPLSPVVELVALPADGTFTVMAVKARTGVGWSASRLLASSAPPNNP